MFMKRLKHALTKPQDLNIDSDYKLICSGLLAICIIFIQYLISIEKPDWLQTISLMLFSFAIPFLAFYIYITQARVKPDIPVSAYLVKSLEATFHIGALCTFLGITTTLAHSSLIIGAVFEVSCVFILTLARFISNDYIKSMKKEIKNKERETREFELEREKLEREKEKLELEYMKLAFERGKLELEQRNLELERSSIIKH